MAKYFRIVGWILLIGFIVGAVIDLISFLANVAIWSKSNQEYLIVICLISFILCLFFGPAFGLLFISYGNHIEETNASVVEKTKTIKSVNKNKEDDGKDGRTVIILCDLVDPASGTFIPKGTMGKIITDYGEYYRVQFLVNNIPVSVLEKTELFSL